MKMQVGAGVVALAMAFSFSGNVNAVPCGTAGVTPNTGCEDGVGANDSESAMNSNSYFGINTWELLDKTDEGGPNSDFWTGDFSGPNGDFLLDSGIWSAYDDLSVVLKDGVTGTNDDVFWSAYLLEEDTLAYDWDYDGRKDISHLSLYGTGDGNGNPNNGNGGNEVPAPAPLALMAAGLLGMGWGRKLWR
jgi:hypothetical protein